MKGLQGNRSKGNFHTFYLYINVVLQVLSKIIYYKNTICLFKIIYVFKRQFSFSVLRLCLFFVIHYNCESIQNIIGIAYLILIQIYVDEGGNGSAM